MTSKRMDISTNSRTLSAFSNRVPTGLVLLHTSYTCASKPGCLTPHNWLHNPDCKAFNEMTCSASQHTLHSASSRDSLLLSPSALSADCCTLAVPSWHRLLSLSSFVTLS